MPCDCPPVPLEGDVLRCAVVACGFDAKWGYASNVDVDARGCGRVAWADGVSQRVKDSVAVNMAEAGVVIGLRARVGDGVFRARGGLRVRRGGGVNSVTGDIVAIQIHGAEVVLIRVGVVQLLERRLYRLGTAVVADF